MCQVLGTDLGVGLFELAAAQPGQCLVVSAAAKASAASWPNACPVAEVEIDPENVQVEGEAYARP